MHAFFQIDITNHTFFVLINVIVSSRQTIELGSNVVDAR